MSRALVGCCVAFFAVSGCVALFAYKPWDPTRPPPSLFTLETSAFRSHAVARIGDVDGDGLADLATVTAVSEHVGSVCSGIDGHVLFTLTAQDAGTFASRSVVGPGDLNGDGVPDVLVSEGAFGEERGIIWAYSGTNGDLLYAVSGEEPGWRLGNSLTATGDLDGDGRGDWCASVSEPDRALRFASGATGEVLGWLRAPTAGEEFGWSVRTVGDLDGDGLLELAVRSSLVDDVLLVHVYRGSDRSLLWTLGPDLGWDGLRGLPSNAGDRDEDGTPDLWVATDGGIRVASGRDGRHIEDVNSIDSAWVVPLGDYDGDGIVDLMFSWWINEEVPALFVEINVYSRCRVQSGSSGEVLFEHAFTHPFPSLIHCGDLEGDGGVEFAAGIDHAMRVISWPESS